MARILVLLILLAAPVLSFGQFVPGEGDDKVEVTPNITPKKAIIKFSALSPFALPKSVRIGLEVTLSDRVSVEPEIGYIYMYNSEASKLNNSILNLEQRLAVRYYVPEDAINGLYIAPLLSYSSFNYTKGTWRNLVPGQPDSTWFVDYSNAAQYQQINFRAYATAGIQVAIFHHFAIDICGGYGMNIESTVTKFSPAISKGEQSPGPLTSVSPEGLFSVHVGYAF